MGSIHIQAMQQVYQQVQHRLFEHLTQVQRVSLQLLIQRLVVAAGGMERLDGFKVMLAYAGGQDSAHALIFLRAAQLSIAARSPQTFRLRVVSSHHSAISGTVLDNIERAYSALMLHDDPRVELLMIDDGQVRPFDAQRGVSPEQQRSERRELLMSGQLTAGQPRATFFNRCYLDLTQLYRQGCTWGGGVDAVINAVPLSKRKRYLAWGRRMLREAGSRRNRPIEAFPAAMLQGFARLRGHYQQQWLGCSESSVKLAPMRRVPRFIGIEELVQVPEKSANELLEHVVDFHYDEVAFGFNESSCANPLLIAHLQGLRAEYLANTSYQQGLNAYLNRCGGSYRRPRLPVSLARRALYGKEDSEGCERRRQQANDLAMRAYGLKETQLVCLLFAPFVDEGRALEAYLQRCHPDMLKALPYLHKALLGLPVPKRLTEWLESTSGLSLESLQRLYQRTS